MPDKCPARWRDIMFTLTSLRSDRFSWPAALSLALASELSYQDKAAVERVATTGWGFEVCEFLSVADTQAFIAQASGVAMVAFRGSESLGDWLANLKVLSTEGSHGGVHKGFFEAYRLVHAAVERTLLAGGSASRNIWLTGHSLGGALATIAAAELQEGIKFAGIHTFGQPRVGFQKFGQYIHQRSGERFVRFVNNDDLVTRVPPGYEHVGRLIHFDPSGQVEDGAGAAELKEPPPLTPAEFEAVKQEIRAIEADLGGAGALSDETLDATAEGLIPGLRDHKIAHYIAFIRARAGVSSGASASTYAPTRGERPGN
jgi:hypothetical protein